MLRTSDLYILADDLTGACDVAACFSPALGPVDVYTSPEAAEQPAKPAVINTQTRLLCPQAGYEILKSIGQKLTDKKIIFKKIDTALRGPVGAELQGLLDGLGKKTPPWQTIVAPAIPKIGKTTRNSLQLEKGVPIDQSVYADDVITPANSADIAEVIRQTGKLEFKVCDAQTDDDLRNIIPHSLSGNKKIFVGSLGLADALAEKLEVTITGRYSLPIARRIMIICGSKYQRSHTQIENAAADIGTKVIYIHPLQTTPEQLSCPGNKNICLVSITTQKIETSDCPAWQILSRFVSTVAKLIERFKPDGLCIVGGETAYHLLKELDVKKLMVYGRMAQVIPYGLIEDGRLAQLPLVTKGGSVGPDDSIIKMINLLRTAKEQPD